ncbi:polar amino acid transport system permease protein [Caldalkalibacillus uzonensis]|uniref:Polar amino acid transport system permease protein n=1 Tax=Caldalkalibacillus uzonensis TaxID=353224 RepID=A0ABU0CW63_9BACI|nr:ectoine/hydroxyectoine ABC transporter permease subunit EhuD [Caldalkalibacillus uzonensis]MDQ0340353.1 polar amino acid transport system permease protein [Caldalkalibacillus uzonensis]
MTSSVIWNWEYAVAVFPIIFQAMWVTLSATVLGFMLALILGLAWALARRSTFKPLAWTVAGIVEFIRSTPLLVQLFFLYMAFPQIPYIGVTLDAFTAGVIGLGVHYSTYLSEIYRSGIESIPKGQWEASTALNFSKVQTWTKVILPQAIPPVLPMFGNYLIVMFKETPLLAAITVVEMLQVSLIIGSQSFRYIEPITIVGLLFLLLSYPSALLVRRLEQKMKNRYASGNKKVTREEVTL